MSLWIELTPSITCFTSDQAKIDIPGDLNQLAHPST